MYILITPFMLKVFYEHSFEKECIKCLSFEKRVRECIGLVDYLRPLSSERSL
jgi:hypothetical protein